MVNRFICLTLTIRNIRKHILVIHQRNIQVLVLLSLHFTKLLYDQHFLFLFLIERDLELGKTHTGQSEEKMENFTDKNTKVLPPHVEELKRQVSIVTRELFLTCVAL